MKSLAEGFRELSEGRSRLGRRYEQVPVLVLVCTGMLCGCASLRALASWARRQEPELLRAMGFGRGLAPSYGTIRRVLLAVPLAEFERVLGDWATEILAAEHLGGDYLGLALDGKVLKGSRDGDLPGVKVVSVLVQALGLTLDQRAVPVETNEHKASLPLLEHLTLTNRVVTADAAFMQRDLCRLIVQRQGHYLIVLKDNQADLRQDVTDWFEPFPPTR